MKVGIVGAGPAGLLASQSLSQRGIEHFLLEAGSRHPRLDPIHGVGGAGLYSDGKFSFYPAGTQVWKLEPEEVLNASYDFICRVLRSAGIAETPVWSTTWPHAAPRDIPGETRKSYPSFYLSLDERVTLIHDLAKTAPIRTGSRLVSLTTQGTDLIELRWETADGLHEEVVDGLILATGRLWGIGLRHSLPSSFNRVEMGVRIQQPSDVFAFRDVTDIDPKFIWRRSNPRREYRTFCVCREGEVVQAETPAGTLCSGRKGDSPTGKSNFGLMVRYLDRNTSPSLSVPQPFGVSLADVRRAPANLTSLLGAPLSHHLLEGVALLEQSIGGRLAQATLLGPCVEGVGLYPTIRPHTLRVASDAPVWVAGDAAGVFRGLVPAMLSGHYAGMSLAHEIMKGRMPYG